MIHSLILFTSHSVSHTEATCALSLKGGVAVLRAATPPAHIKGLLAFQLLLSLSFKQQVLHHTDYINDLLNHLLLLSEAAVSPSIDLRGSFKFSCVAETKGHKKKTS